MKMYASYVEHLRLSSCKLTSIALLCCGMFLLPGVVVAQEMEDQVDPENALRDPFEVPDELKPDADKKESSDPEFVVTNEPVKTPRIQLRGYIEVEDKAPFALIEIEGQGTLIVSEGDTISLQRQQSLVLKVVKLSNLSISIQVGKLGQVIVVRS